MKEELKGLEDVKKALLNYTKSVKNVSKKSDKSFSLDPYSATDAQRNRASDALVLACVERDRFYDDLHAYLVDANLCEAKDNYETEIRSNSAGAGHSISFKYTPKIPKSIGENK